MRTIGNRVGGLQAASRVQIPLSPPVSVKIKGNNTNLYKDFYKGLNIPIACLNKMIFLFFL